MENIKVYCNSEDKESIKAISAANGLTASRYLLQVGLRDGSGDLPERAMLVQLVCSMVRLTEDQSVRDSLLKIAQDVLEGSPIIEARAKVSKVCKDADKGNQR